MIQDDGACNDAPQSERDELREYLASRLGGERIQKAAEAKVKKEVLPKWREARATAAKRQADDTWPTLADGTWFPPADLADDVTARSDYAKSVTQNPGHGLRWCRGAWVVRKGPACTVHSGAC